MQLKVSAGSCDMYYCCDSCGWQVVGFLGAWYSQVLATVVGMLVWSQVLLHIFWKLSPLQTQPLLKP